MGRLSGKTVLVSGTADEVAEEVCVHPPSDDAAFVTGADFPIDGGVIAR